MVRRPEIGDPSKVANVRFSERISSLRVNLSSMSPHDTKAPESEISEISSESPKYVSRQTTTPQVYKEPRLQLTRFARLRDYLRLFLIYFGRIFRIFAFIIVLLPKGMTGFDTHFRKYGALSVLVTCILISVLCSYFLNSMVLIVFVGTYGIVTALHIMAPDFLDRDISRRWLFGLFFFRMKEVDCYTAEWVITCLSLCIAGFVAGSYEIIMNSNSFFIGLSNLFSNAFFFYAAASSAISYLIATDETAIKFLEPNPIGIALMNNFWHGYIESEEVYEKYERCKNNRSIHSYDEEIDNSCDIQPDHTSRPSPVHTPSHRTNKVNQKLNNQYYHQRSPQVLDLPDTPENQLSPPTLSHQPSQSKNYEWKISLSSLF